MLFDLVFVMIIRLGVCIQLGVWMVLSSVERPIINKKTYFQVKTKWFCCCSIWHENGFWSKKKDKKDKKQNQFLFFFPCTKQKSTFFGQKWKTILFFSFFFCFFFRVLRLSNEKKNFLMSDERTCLRCEMTPCTAYIDL